MKRKMEKEKVIATGRLIIVRALPKKERDAYTINCVGQKKQEVTSAKHNRRLTSGPLPAKRLIPMGKRNLPHFSKTAEGHQTRVIHSEE
jgi:hypothetical protein